MCVVKANAYGHGVKEISKILNKSCRFFGVSNTKEAIELKQIVNKKTNILVLSKTKNYNILIKNNIHITVDSINELIIIERIAKKIGCYAYVHIAINTGMNRIGVSKIDEFNYMLNYIKNCENIKLYGVFTHMFDADQTVNNYYKQINKFKEYINLLSSDVLVHIGGSFCLKQKIPEFVNMVRVGYFLYGYGDAKLKPVMKIFSKVMKIIKVKKNDNIGYGKNIAKKDMTIAIVSIGYADGIPRRISNKGYITIKGVKCKIIARVCMDCLLVDASKIKVDIGDDALVYDCALKFAKWSNTSPYEILTNFNNCRSRTIICS